MPHQENDSLMISRREVKGNIEVWNLETICETASNFVPRSWHIAKIEPTDKGGNVNKLMGRLHSDMPHSFKGSNSKVGLTRSDWQDSVRTD